MAAAAYTAHKGETLPNGSKWEDAILKDFGEFRKRGLGRAQLKRVEEALAVAPDSPEVLDQTAEKLAKEGKYAEALSFAEHYLAEMKSRYGENHAKYAGALDSLGSRLNSVVGRAAEAEPLYKQALALRERVLGHGDMWTLVTVNNLGLLYSNLGRYQEAEALLKRALEGYGSTLGPDERTGAQGRQQSGVSLSEPRPVRRSRAAVQACARCPRAHAWQGTPRYAG